MNGALDHQSRHLFSHHFHCFLKQQTHSTNMSLRNRTRVPQGGPHQIQLVELFRICFRHHRTALTNILSNKQTKATLMRIVITFLNAGCKAVTIAA